MLYKHGFRRKEKSGNQFVPKTDETLSEARARSPVLMVDTIWLWILADDTVLSFAPPREPPDKKPDSRFSENDPFEAVLRSARRKNARICDGFDLAGLIVHRYVDALLRDLTKSNLRLLSKFDQFTSSIVEDQIMAFRRFGNSLSKDRNASYEAFHKTRQRKDLRIDQDLLNFLELRDVQDELSILEHLLNEQRELINAMFQGWSKKIVPDHGRYGTRSLKNAQRRIERYLKIITALKQNAKDAQEGYKDILDLKQTHSGVREAEVASDQARVVNIFTTITIVFSPLSFFAGIFGMVSLLHFESPLHAFDFPMAIFVPLSITLSDLSITFHLNPSLCPVSS